MPISPLRRSINRHVPLTRLGWSVAAMIIMALIVALNIVMDVR